jgi:hypothetical protein
MLYYFFHYSCKIQGCHRKNRLKKVAFVAYKHQGWRQQGGLGGTCPPVGHNVPPHRGEKLHFVGGKFKKLILKNILGFRGDRRIKQKFYRKKRKVLLKIQQTQK